MHPMLHPDDVRRHLNLVVQEGLFEVRFLPTDRRPPIHNLIQPSDIDAAIDKVCEFSRDGYNCYLALNPLHEAIRQSSTAAKDAFVRRRRWLYIDIDADKHIKADVMATSAERDEALRRSDALEQRLASDGWPHPVMIDSGNGAAMLYRIDLPNDDETTGLIKRCLAALQKIEPQVDVKVYNAARISRIVGTINRKGEWVEQTSYDDPSQWRPWRVAEYRSFPQKIEVLQKAKIEAVEGVQAVSHPPSSTLRTRSSGVGVSDEQFARKVFWAMYFERFGEDVSGTETALSQAGFEIKGSDSEGVFIRSPLEASYTTPVGERDVEVFAPYLNLSTFHKSDHDASWTWRDGVEFARRYLPSFWHEVEAEVERKTSRRAPRSRDAEDVAAAGAGAEHTDEEADEKESDVEPLAKPEEDLVGQKCPLVIPVQGMPRFVVSVARMIQQRTPIVSDLGAFVAASHLSSMMLGKSVSFVQQGNRRYDALTLIYTARSGRGKSDLCRTIYQIGADLGVDLDQSNDINVPTFFKHYAKRVELQEGNKAKMQREIIEQGRRDPAICLIVDEFRNFLDNMIGTRNSQQIGYASKLCNMLDDELILTYETRTGGNLWIGDPCIKIFGACVDSDLDILEDDLVRRKGLTARMLVANETMLDARLAGKFVLTEQDRERVARIARLAPNVDYEVVFADKDVENARNAAVEHVPYLRGTLNRLGDEERQTLLSKTFTQCKKLAASWAVLDWLWEGCDALEEFALDHQVVSIDGGPWIAKAVSVVLAFHCSTKNQMGFSSFAEARKIILDYLNAKRGWDNRKFRRPSIILRNRKRLTDLGFGRLQDFRALLNLLLASGDIVEVSENKGRRHSCWYDARVTE